MKQEITPQKNLEILSHYIIAAYNSAPQREKGVIQLNLLYRGEVVHCYFQSDGERLHFNFGEINCYDAKLTAKLYDWLDLAGGRLSPVWGVITRRLKFEGDHRVFDRLINKELIYKIDHDISDTPSHREIVPVRLWKKPQRVMVINGSPRGRGGYTFHYLNRLIEGLEIGGATVTTVELGQKKINSCIGCFHCWKNNTGRCTQADDVNDLYDLYNDSDLIVYAFPLYWDTIPGIVKNFIERAFCLEQPYMIPGLYKTRHPRRVRGDKSFFVFSVCGFPEQIHFDAVKKYFRGVSHNAHIPQIGGIYRSACMFLANDPMYYKTYNLILDSIRKAGEILCKNGKIDTGIINAIQTKIDPEEFRLHANKFWDNVVLKDDYFVKCV